MPGFTESHIQPPWGAVKPETAGNWAGSLPDDFPGRENLTIRPNQVETIGGATARLEPGPRGFEALSHQEAGKAIRLTSAGDPRAEDLALVERLNPQPQAGVLCCGLGLGYHLEELARRLDPSAPLWVLESRPELAACALQHRDLSALFQRPGFRLFVGPFNGQPWTKDEKPPTQILWRPATRRHFASEYPALGPEPSARPRPSARRLLLFQSGYFLDRELRNAAKELGLDLSVWNFQRGLTASGDNYKELLELIKNFRPNLVLTVNHLGFDAEGLMNDLFTRLSLPAASWFVDSPAFILGAASRPSPLVGDFICDHEYMETLQSKGFIRVSHLPLATDGTIFKPAGQPRTIRSLAFVGDSLSSATAKYLNKLGRNSKADDQSPFLKSVDELAANFLNDSNLVPDPAALQALALDSNPPIGPEGLNDLAALVTWRASRIWRRRVLAALPPQDLTVAGDHHWRQLLKLPAANLAPPLDYYRDLAPFYQGSQVNLNITSAQMKSGLNQRVFDVPAAGAFLLTDRRAQLFDLFEPEREVVTYNEPDEARELAGWYLKHPEARAKIVQAARNRILGQHLYRHRLAQLLKEMDQG